MALSFRRASFLCDIYTMNISMQTFAAEVSQTQSLLIAGINCFLDKSDVNNESLGDLLAHVTPVSWLLWNRNLLPILTHANASGAQSSDVEVDYFEIPQSAKILAWSVVCCTWQMDEAFVLLALLSCLSLAKGGTTGKTWKPQPVKPIYSILKSFVSILHPWPFFMNVYNIKVRLSSRRLRR